ncbi:hypothetical protein Tco_1183725 [Tanacetum coccineum]
MGECSAIPTDPYHTPTFIQPSTQPQKTQQPRKPKRKDTQVPQPSNPIENVVDKVVHKELGDSLVRAATIASSLEAKHDSGNINKIQSKATPNESSSQGTNSGGGPWRVKKLEKKDRSRNHRLKRLYKVGLTARVESSDNEESLGKDASKQGRIDAIDADEEITLVSVHDVNVSAGEELIIDTPQVSAARDIVSAASDATTVSVDDITLAQALEEMKNTKPKKKRVVIQELGKGILIEHVKPIKKKDQIRLNEETALNLQAEFDEEERLAREKAEKEKEANISLIKTWDDIQAKIDADHQVAKRMQNMEGYKLKDLKLKEFDSIQQMFDRTKLVKGKEKRVGTELVQEIIKKQKVEDEKEQHSLNS